MGDIEYTEQGGVIVRPPPARAVARGIPPRRVGAYSAAVALVGAPELASGLEEIPDPVATLIERLRGLPEEQRRKLLVAFTAATGAVLAFVPREWSANAQHLLALLLALLTLREALKDSLGGD